MNEIAMERPLRREDFLPLVGSSVVVAASGHEATVEILEASALASPSPRNEPFRLIFRSSPNWRAAQGIYRMQHPRLGPLDLFVVPVGPDGTGLCYEAIFN